jgi:hypothetical protein
MEFSMPQAPIPKALFPKVLLPAAACLLLCAAAAIALIATNASAESAPTKPVMAALADAPPLEAPSADGSRVAMCGEIGARAAGNLAYLQARLELTAAQAPLFERWKNTRLAAAGRMEAACKARPPRQARRARTPVERLALQEEMLKRQLADISAERPALAALYGSLNETQRNRFDGGGPRMAALMLRHQPMEGPPPSEDAPPPPPQ